MKLKDGVVISQINDQYVAVAADEAGKAFNGMLRMNQTAAFLLELLKKETSEETLVASILDRYKVSQEMAAENVHAVLEQLKTTGLLDFEK